ncbi:MAG TPA: polysaccharide deacetylase family protein [Gemmatimonadaceae bacterium]|jgi:peptidoglycan/xylan/chitin deacetylase (PgdA/CDA1 family)
MEKPLVRQVLRAAKSVLLSAVHRTGVLDRVRDSRWRQQRLLILAYHGVSLDDEHQWNPELYMSPSKFESRLAALERGSYTVLPLADALVALDQSRLPPRSVALTFDDGSFDFSARVFPALKAHGFPATVYLTTYYCEYNRPVFGPACSYMLWKARHIGSLNVRALTGADRSFPLASAGSRDSVVQAMLDAAARDHMTAREKDEMAGRLAQLIGVDYDELRAKRILHLMNTEEVTELAAQGVDFQLHTHRHRIVDDAESVRREIRDNRVRIERLTNQPARHFCYPSGLYDRALLPSLESEQVESATTCDPGLVSSRSSRLLLPRFVDTQLVSDAKFDGWLSGAAALLPGRRSYGRLHV